MLWGIRLLIGAKVETRWKHLILIGTSTVTGKAIVHEPEDTLLEIAFELGAVCTVQFSIAIFKIIDKIANIIVTTGIKFPPEPRDAIFLIKCFDDIVVVVNYSNDSVLFQTIFSELTFGFKY